MGHSLPGDGVLCFPVRRPIPDSQSRALSRQKSGRWGRLRADHNGRFGDDPPIQTFSNR